jgi:ribonuclease P protein component
MDQRFTWSERLHRHRDFSRVIREGRRFSLSGLILWVYQHSDAPESVQRPRLGLAIPRTFGNAVRRNRLKRLLREVFRLKKAELPRGVDMVFSARPIDGKLTLQFVEPMVLELWKRAKLCAPT